MTINSRQKGAAAEREVANILKDRGFDAHRGQQFHGGGDSPDVVGLPGFHLEVKRVERGGVYDWMDQAQRDAALDSVPLVVHRRSKKPWVVILRFDDFLNLLENAHAKP